MWRPRDPLGDPSSPDPMTALVVGARESLRRPAALALSEARFRVKEAATPGEAMARSRALRPHVIVLDVALGPHDGIELCRRLRVPSDHGTPLVVLVLDDATERPFLEASLVGADDFVTRPYAPTELARKVLAGLRRRAPAVHRREFA